MARLWIVLGGINAFLAVALGAMGAHKLQEILTPKMLEIYKTGANYQMLHALGLILIGIWAERRTSRLANVSGGLLTAGIVLFSGSLYAYSLSGVVAWAIITPLGGLCFLAGWILFVVAALPHPRPLS
jgi:uncharacterized membrane protein YgdD (TMEM256/DUF423 family)